MAEDHALVQRRVDSNDRLVRKLYSDAVENILNIVAANEERQRNRQVANSKNIHGNLTIVLRK